MFIVYVHCSLFMFIVHCSHGATLIFDDVFFFKIIQISHVLISFSTNIFWSEFVLFLSKTIVVQSSLGLMAK